MVLDWNFFWTCTHASGTIFFFFSFSFIKCVSMQSVLRVIFSKQLRYFLSRKGYTALFDLVWNRIYVKILNAKTRKTFRNICVRKYVCMSVSIEMWIWSEGDASALYFLLSFLLCKQFYTNSCWPLVQVGKRKVNYHSWSTSRS